MSKPYELTRRLRDLGVPDHVPATAGKGEIFSFRDPGGAGQCTTISLPLAAGTRPGTAAASP